MDERAGVSPPKAVRNVSFHETGSSRHRPESIELRPIKSLPALPSGPVDTAWQPRPPRIRPMPHLSPTLERLEGRSPTHFQEEQKEKRWSRCAKRFSALPDPSNPVPPQDERREMRWSQLGQQHSTPPTFRDSVWLSEPEKLMLQFQFANKDESELFDPPHHILNRSKKKRLVYLVSLAAVFSPLSSNIYFPALTAIAEVCVQLIFRWIRLAELQVSH